MLKHRANVGFTLIEVMITVVIIGILATPRTKTIF
jgi:prepilin-type N-terminal cleavage/methylation domain-containing protein